MQQLKNNIHQCLEKIINSDIKSHSALIFTTYLELIELIKANVLEEEELTLYFSDPTVINYVHKAQVFFYKWESYIESVMQAYFIDDTLPLTADRIFFESLRAYYIEQYRPFSNE